MRSIWLRARLDTAPRFCGLEIGNAVPHHRQRGIPKGGRTPSHTPRRPRPRNLCARSGCVVASVDYRLAPEHKFPARIEDCLYATRWAAAHAAELGAGARRVAVAGDSAGGNVAAVTALRLRNEGGPALCGQLLLHPVTDYHTPAAEGHEDQFPPPRLSAGCGFRKETFAGAHSNGRDAPIPAVR